MDEVIEHPEVVANGRQLATKNGVVIAHNPISETLMQLRTTSNQFGKECPDQ